MSVYARYTDFFVGGFSCTASLKVRSAVVAGDKPNRAGSGAMRRECAASCKWRRQAETRT